jgi:nitrogen fixation protein
MKNMVQINSMKKISIYFSKADISEAVNVAKTLEKNS